MVLYGNRLHVCVENFPFRLWHVESYPFRLCDVSVNGFQTILHVFDEVQIIRLLII